MWSRDVGVLVALLTSSSHPWTRLVLIWLVVIILLIIGLAALAHWAGGGAVDARAGGAGRQQLRTRRSARCGPTSADVP